MKTILGCLCDPYLHVIVIGVVLLRMGMDANPSGTEVESGPKQVYCAGCLEVHDEFVGGCQLSGMIKLLTSAH